LVDEVAIETRTPSPKAGEVVGLAPGQPQYRVLIVEDQRDNQLLLSRLMENVGMQVKIAENGAKGIQLFQTWKPHFIWMDRRMPVMDGLEATQHIRELPDGKSVKIVAVTASAFEEQRSEMLEGGMDDYVRKPYRLDEIYDTIAKHLGVKYLYKEPPDIPKLVAPLTSEALKILPEKLRSDFAEALTSLDSNRIDTLVQQVAPYDEALHKTLSHLVVNFDYHTILQCLQNIE
jgi:CheY-like chemotaxis protein